MAEYDIVIVGSGMVGLCFANFLLKQTSYNIALVGAINPLENKNTARVCAFNHNSLNILRYLGCDANYFNNNCTFYNDVHIWTEPNRTLNFNAAELGFTNIGGVIPNHLVEIELWQKLQNNTRVSIYCPSEAKAWEFNGKQHIIKLGCNTILKSKLLIGADGKNSWVRGKVGINTSNSSYEQNAIVAKLSCSKAHNNTAWQKFLPTGPLAFLPLNNAHEVSIVWSSNTKHSDYLMQMSDADFTKELAVCSDNVLGNFDLLSKRFSYKLEAQHAESYIANHVALLGDAAHVAHPLAGQGVNAGLLDAAILSDKLSSISDDKLQLALVHYQKETRGRNSTLIFAMGQIKSLFETKNPLLKLGRNFGFDLVNRSNQIKRQLAKHALGLSNNLPKTVLHDSIE